MVQNGAKQTLGALHYAQDDVELEPHNPLSQ